MKLISLNAWGCRITESFLAFVTENVDSTDIFCFQEILKGGQGRTGTFDELKSAFEDISGLLQNHTGYFLEYGKDGYYDEPLENRDFDFGIASFVRSSLKHSRGDGCILRDSRKTWSDYSGRLASGVALAVLIDEYVVVNIHGLWQGSIKEDTEAKIEQSKQILDFAQKFEGKKIICGDFNLLPHTKSIQMLRDEYQDLIQDYGIVDTRGSLYTKTLRHSDYAFVDKDIKVDNFSVPKLDISDHLPLVIEFE